MRENCTYGSMRGRAFPTGRPALLLLVLPMVQRREGFVRMDGQNGGMGRRPLRVLRFMVNSGWYLSKFDLYYRSHLRQTYPVVEDPFRKIDWKSESRRNGSCFVYANFVLLTGRDKTIGPTGHDDSHWYAHEATEYMSDILFKHIEKRCLRSREVRVLREWSRVALLK